MTELSDLVQQLRGNIEETEKQLELKKAGLVLLERSLRTPVNDVSIEDKTLPARAVVQKMTRRYTKRSTPSSETAAAAAAAGAALRPQDAPPVENVAKPAPVVKAKAVRAGWTAARRANQAAILKKSRATRLKNSKSKKKAA